MRYRIGHKLADCSRYPRSARGAPCLGGMGGSMPSKRFSCQGGYASQTPRPECGLRIGVALPRMGVQVGGGIECQCFYREDAALKSGCYHISRYLFPKVCIQATTVWHSKVRQSMGWRRGELRRMLTRCSDSNTVRCAEILNGDELYHE